MTPYDKQKQGEKLEGWAFTFCKAAFLVLLFGHYSLLALSGLATACYLLAAVRGVTRWHCWAKPPWVTVFWAAIFLWQLWLLLPHPFLRHR